MTPLEIVTRIKRTLMLQCKRRRTCGELLELAKNKLWIQCKLYDDLLDMMEGNKHADQGAKRAKR